MYSVPRAGRGDAHESRENFAVRALPAPLQALPKEGFWETGLRSRKLLTLPCGLRLGRSNLNTLQEFFVLPAVLKAGTTRVGTCFLLRFTYVFISPPPPSILTIEFLFLS